MHKNKFASQKPIFVLQTYDERIAGKELSQKLSERLTTLQNQETTEDRFSTLSRSTSSTSATSVGPPPPPPPLPDADMDLYSDTLKPNKVKPKAPPVPIKHSTLSFRQPPPCPTPDYDTLSITSNSSTRTIKQNGYNNNKTSQSTNDSVEMESLESFVLYNPSGIKPKPPNTYFNKSPLSSKLSNGSISSTTSTTRKQRPISVTIGEYPSGTIRRQPGRLDFLQNGSDETDKAGNQPITSQLASELAQTLNRSNLRRRTESMENLLNCPQIKPQSNGSVRISLNHTPKSLTKSTNDLSAANIEQLSKILQNRVTININPLDKKNETPNGILKNGNGNNPIPTHKQLVHQKSITFGEMPTVINDHPLHVT